MEEMKDRQAEIREKGFDMRGSSTTEYGKMKVGVRTLDDAVLNLGTMTRSPSNVITKSAIYQAIVDGDMAYLREISNFFYDANGIYQRICKYFAAMYRYDWYVVPEVMDKTGSKDKIVKEFNKLLRFLDNSYIPKTCSDIALNVIKNGAYYAYIVPSTSSLILQELPIGYCRSRYNSGNLPVIEFNMKFFDKAFPNTTYRMKVLNMFPDEFKKGYVAYKSGKLIPEDGGRFADNGWWALDPRNTVKFSLNDYNGRNMPLFISAIPAIIDLDRAQDLDRRKQMQKLLKILIQKLPMDKNGELIFDIDEARDIHNNAVEMLKRAVGVDVLTTFADVESIDMSDKNTATTQDDLSKVERGVYNSFGVSQNMFNTNGGMALEKSVLNDEGAIRTLLQQFEMFFDRVAQNQSSSQKKYNFRLYMLETTQYNYRDLSKLYKEQVQIGYSKMLPQIALGHSQSSILNMAYFENDILHLNDLMIPPLMSSTMNLQDLKAKNEKGTSNKNQIKIEEQSKGNAGRPEKPDDQKSDKTIQNKEAMS